MANEWRFLILDTKTLQPQAELPALDATFGETLNAAGSASVTIPLDAPGITTAMLTPPDCVLMVERDNVPLWIGPVWTWDMDVEQGTLKLGCEGYHSFLRHRVIREDRDYSIEAGWHGEKIAYDLIEYTQSTYGTFSINNRTQTSTPFRERHYSGYERKPIAEAIEQLATVSDGFDFRYVPRWLGSSFVTVDFVTTYPALGRLTDIVLELGATADILGATLDGTNLAYRVDAIGSGMGSSTPISTESDDGLIFDHGIDLHAVVVLSDVSETDTLDSYALDRLAAGRAPVIIPRVAVDPSLLGEFVVGDRVFVRGEYGLLSINDWYRITSYSMNMTDTDTSLTLTLAPLELYE